MRIQNKLFLTIAPLFLIGIVLLTSVAYQAAERSIVSQARESKVLILQQVSEKLESINQNMLSVSNIYFLDVNIRRWLRNDPRLSEYDKHRSLQKMIETVNQTGNYFKHLKYSTAFIGLKGDSYSSSTEEQGSYDFAQEFALTENITDKNKTFWSDTYLHHGKSVFSAVRYLRDVYTGDDLGWLVLDFEERLLFEAYKNLDGVNLMIVNGDGRVLSDRDQRAIGTSYAAEPFFLKLRPYESGSFITEVENRKSLVTFRKVPQMNWYLVEINPVSVLLDDMNDVRQLVFLSAAAIAIGLFALSYYFSYRISAPLKRLVRSMQHAQSGDFKMLVSIDRKDEIGILIRKYNTMLGRIEQLLVEVQHKNELKRQAEMQALQSQINPHFLYNTLNSIRWMAKINDTGTVNKMIISLVRLLRQSFSKGQEWISFDEELKFLADYILIQQVRYGDKFDVIFDFEEEVKACRTLKLLIQPLLENAIFHGIEPKNENGTIRIEARVQGGQIILTIADDGVGMDPEKGRNGLGIRSVEQRIKLHFGENYGLKVDSRIGSGTCVTLSMPIIYENNEKNNEER